MPNADIAKAEQAHEIIRFCEFWQEAADQPPGRLVFDSTLTTHAELAELAELEIGFITLRIRGATPMQQVAALPQDAWQAVHVQRPGKHRDVTVAEMTATIAKHPFRQLAVKGLGRDQPTLLLTNQRDRTAKQLIERYAQRWIIENQLAERVFFEDVMAADDAFLDKASEGLALYAFNKGEVCTCPSRALIQESTSYRAAVVGAFGNPLTVEDVPIPDLKPGQVRVKVQACGLCHTDIHPAHGATGRSSPPRHPRRPACR